MMSSDDKSKASIQALLLCLLDKPLTKSCHSAYEPSTLAKAISEMVANHDQQLSWAVCGLN